MTKGKSIILGITGGVAAYKALDLIREMRKEGKNVKVLMTESSKKFVTALSLEVASGNPVLSDTFESPFAHIETTKDADAMVVAPATANTISKFACGIADNLLTIAFMSFKGSKIIVPSMNWRMYQNPILQDKLDYLKNKGVVEIPPESGHLACGEEGIGRMARIETIMNALERALTKQDLKGLNVVVSAGPTREYIDPIRFISNRSSGKMGFSLAKTAYLRGADVTVISGSTCLNPLTEIEFIAVETTEEMEKAIMNKAKGTDIVIMAAAVADFKPERSSLEKIERRNHLALHLLKTNDILSTIASLNERPFTVGFSAEVGNKKDRARKKLLNKGIDMVVFNDVTVDGAGFDTDTNVVTILNKNEEFSLPRMSKDDVSNAIYDKILEKSS